MLLSIIYSSINSIPIYNVKVIVIYATKLPFKKLLHLKYTPILIVLNIIKVGL